MKLLGIEKGREESGYAPRGTSRSTRFLPALFFLILIVTVTSVGWAGGPSVQLRVDVNPKTILIGDRIQYSLMVQFSSSVAASPLEIPHPWGDFEVLAVSTEPPQITDDKVLLSNHMLLTTFSTGTLTIPSLTMKFLVPGGQMAEAKTEEVQITVRSLLAEKGDIGGLMPLKAFFTFRSYLWVWILVGTLILAGLVFWIWRSALKRKGLLGMDQGPVRPPEETIWEVIDRLERSDLVATGQIKEFYSQLSQAVRVYLEERYRMPALDRTTSELLAEFRRIDISLDLQSIIRYFFETGDLAKFAKYTPSEDEVADDLDRVKKFVSLTTPKKEESTETEKPPL